MGPDPKQLKELIIGAKYISDLEKDSVLKKLDSIDDENIPEELASAITDLLDQDIANAKEELSQVESEMEEIEQENIDVIKEAAQEDVEEMQQVADDYKQAASQIEGDYEKAIEGEVTKGDESEADDIRKKLGIS